MVRIDCHSHVGGMVPGTAEVTSGLLVELAERLEIDSMCCSNPMGGGAPTPAEFSACNEAVVKAMREYPDVILGYCFVNPGYRDESLKEIDKRVAEDGMMGVKLYNQYRCSDPVVYPIVQKSIEMKVPILQHAGYLTDPTEAAKQPNISSALDIVKLASLFPDAILIEAHLTGGGDWEWALKHLRGANNVFLDTSGSGVDCGAIEKAVKCVGADRLLFGTDLSLEEGVGKILAANISEEDRQLIFGQNMTRILERRSR